MAKTNMLMRREAPPQGKEEIRRRAPSSKADPRSETGRKSAKGAGRIAQQAARMRRRAGSAIAVHQDVRAAFRKFGLARTKLREAANVGNSGPSKAVVSAAL